MLSQDLPTSLPPAMSHRDACRQAVAVWLMEFSVLWAVFPVMNQLVENRSIDLNAIGWSLGMSLTAFTSGLMLIRGNASERLSRVRADRPGSAHRRTAHRAFHARRAGSLNIPTQAMCRRLGRLNPRAVQGTRSDANHALQLNW